MEHMNFNQPDFENEYNLSFSENEEQEAGQILLILMIIGLLFFIAGVIFWALFGAPIINFLKAGV